MAHDVSDLAALERSFRDRGYSFDIFVDPPGRQWLGFVHARGCAHCNLKPATGTARPSSA